MADGSFNTDRTSTGPYYPTIQELAQHDNGFNNAIFQAPNMAQKFLQPYDQVELRQYTDQLSFDLPSVYFDDGTGAAPSLSDTPLGNNDAGNGAYPFLEGTASIHTALFDASHSNDNNTAPVPLVCQDCGDELEAFGDDVLDATCGSCTMASWETEAEASAGSETGAGDTVEDEETDSEDGSSEVEESEIGDDESEVSDDGTGDDIDFFSDEEGALDCLDDDDDDDVEFLAVGAANDDVESFTPEVIKAEAKKAFRLFHFLDPNDHLPTAALGTVVVDKPHYDASQAKELARIKLMLSTQSQRQKASARATLALTSLIDLHKNGIGVRVSKKRSGRTHKGDYNLTASARWAKIKRAIRVNKFIARDVVQGNPKHLEELVRGPDLYLHKKSANFRGNGTKGTTLAKETKKKRAIKAAAAAAAAAADDSDD